MEISLMKIVEFLNLPKSVIRRADEKDVLTIKNELLMLLNNRSGSVEYEKDQIRKLINELQYLNVYVVKDDYEKIIYSYEPPKYSTPRVTLKESGWIEIVK